jgi:hypothetical protein
MGEIIMANFIALTQIISSDQKQSLLFMGEIIMANFIALTQIISSDQKQTIHINLDHVRFLQPASVGGGTILIFDDEQNVVAEETPDRIVMLADH